jgi:DNA primase large subunit
MPLRQDAKYREQDIKRDHVSHFIMRLAYCRTEDLRRWFREQELTLFRYRLETTINTSKDALREFMEDNGMRYEEVRSQDRDRYRDSLVGLCGVTTQNIDLELFYKIPFTEAGDLIKRREVFLRGGYAFVPLRKVKPIILLKFKLEMNKALAKATNLFERVISSDTRIGPLLKNMNNQYSGRDHSKSTNVDKLTIDKIDAAADMHMPLCMKNQHKGLRADSHLKHQGRLQYSLFLKGAGLSLDEAMLFWEQAFSRLTPHDKFQKEYAYNFRHSYGKEGAKKDYTPYSCLKIIMGTPPAAGQYHGCPFKHFGENQLAATLQGLSLDGKETNAIMSKVKSHDYQLACQLHFDAVHKEHHKHIPGEGDAAATHPNQWFKASLAYGKAKTGKNAVDAGVKKEIGSPASSGTAGTAVTPGNDSEEACPEVSSMDVEGGDVPAVTPTPSAPAAQAAAEAEA